MNELSQKTGASAEHVTDQQFQQLIGGTLPADEQTWIESHLDACERCLQRLSSWGDESSKKFAAQSPASPPHPEFSAGLIDRISREIRQSEPTSLPDEQTSVTTALQRIRSIGRGGHGEVFEYRDHELGRSVAIKLLQARWAHMPTHVSRFRREMELTASIDHPGCPAVYGRGTTADGRDFFLMQLVTGEPLDEAIRRFHRERGTRLLRRDDRELRSLLQIFRQLCQALTAAHQQGIIHRDLKPQNVRVHAVGHPVILDWGIAKRLGTDDPAPVAESTAAGAVELTQAEQRLGTFVYMAPEQARGEHAQLSQQTDIYGLGAILYEILLGRPPHEDLVRQHTESAKVLELLGRMPPPNCSGIPAELASICRRAMQTNPADRYPSALALADDLDHWMASEPVGAHSYRWWDRIGLAIRRQPRLFAAGTAAVLVVMVGGEAIRQFAVEADRQRAAADAQQNIAEDRFRLALDAYTANVRDVRAELEDDGPTRAARQKLLERAVAGIQQLAASAKDHPGAERIVIEARKELADIQRLEQGQLSESLASYEKLIESMRRLPSDIRAAEWFQKEWLDILKRRAGVVESLKGATQAIPYWDEVFREIDQFAARHQNQPIGWLAQSQVATLQGQRAELQGAEGLPQAIAHFEQALAAINRVPPPKADEATYLYEKSMVLGELARVLAAVPQLDRAIDLQKQVIEVDHRIIAKEPVRDYLLGLYQDQNALGTYYKKNQDFASAETVLQSAIADAEKTVQRFPDDQQFHRIVGQLRHNLGTALRQLQRFADARAAIQPGLKDANTLNLETSPVDELEDQCTTLMALAQVWEDEGERPKALELYLQALPLREAILARAPDDFPNKKEMLITAQRCGELADAGDAVTIADKLSQVVQALDGEKQADPWPPSMKKQIGILYFQQGFAKIAAAEKTLRRDDLQAANLAYQRAKQILTTLPDFPPSALGDLDRNIRETEQQLQKWPATAAP